ncbi:P-loop containing nucleoside triphosphate hydrolase protein [Choiromyces venosus 120613-1]|uniref:P-loop containing nucleoside triphosphate hydrolase protein n=1 Tax=Choiromyces venosus 120613-1 TaxID=1336337 RepID=A0A3N4K410_9PEZI|nr:P-loop containing nucleoside triphosphate hydrolase protein [Choiromyces venosus 120613-1]
MRRTVQCARAYSNLLWTSSRRPTRPTLPAFALSLLPQRAWNSGGIKLRGYQEECIQAILKGVDEGERRMAISLATGGGKTVVFTELISRLIHPARPEAEKTLILVHRRELVQQAAKQCQKQYPEKIIDIEMGTSHASGGADIIIASVQSIINRLDKYDAELYKLILIDECHHAVSKSYLEVLTHFNAMDVNERTPVVVGVSATVSRFDGLSLGKVMDKLVFHMDSTTMIKNKWLSPPRFTTVNSSVDLEGVKETATGDFDIGGLAQAVNTDVANDVIIKAWLDRASERKSTLVFCVDLSHVRSVMDKFRAHGIDAREITSRTSIQVRRECLEEFKMGKFPVMVNCGVFTEVLPRTLLTPPKGTDIPNIDCVILARPTRSKNLITQMIGRGLRKSENTGKTDCHIIDMVTNLSHGIVTTPTLFGLDPDMLVNEMTLVQMHAIAAKEAEAKRKAEEEEKRVRFEILQAEQEKLRAIEELRREEEARLEEEIRKMKEEKKMAEETERLIAQEEERLRIVAAKKMEMEVLARSPPPLPLQLEYVDYDDVWDLLSDNSPDQVVAQMSRLAWVSIDRTKYVLSCGRNGYITVERDFNGWFNVEEFRALPPGKGLGKWARPKLIMSGIEQLDAAIRGADTYALNTYPRVLLERDARWRKLSASDQQLEFLKKLRRRGHKDWEDMRKHGQLTKGKVGDIITRVKHGAMRKFDEKMKEQKRKQKEEAKELRRKRREEVRLGVIE